MALTERKKQARLAMERLPEDSFKLLLSLFEKELEHLGTSYLHALQYKLGDRVYKDENLRTVMDYIYELLLPKRHNGWLLLELGRWLKACQDEWKATIEVLEDKQLVKQLRDAENDRQKGVGLISWPKNKADV